MASISTDRNGNRNVIQFVGPDGKRRTLRLSGAPEKTVEDVAGHIDALVLARKTGTSLDRSTRAWLSLIATPLEAKLARAGLVDPHPGPDSEPPAFEATPLCSFLRDYIDRRTDVKPNTRRNLEA